MATPQLAEYFGTLANYKNFKDVVQLIRDNPGKQDARRRAAAYGMVLAATQSIGKTDFFEDSRRVVDSLSEAKKEVDIAAWHTLDIAEITSRILMTAQRFLDQNTIACTEWPSPKEVAEIATEEACKCV